MADSDTQANNPEAGTGEIEETFTPVGSLFLLVIYIMVFASAWGLIYFTDLLARR